MGFTEWFESQNKFSLIVMVAGILISILVFKNYLPQVLPTWAFFILVGGSYMLWKFYQQKQHEFIMIDTNYYKRIKGIAETACPTGLRGKMIKIVSTMGKGVMDVGVIVGYAPIIADALGGTLAEVNKPAPIKTEAKTETKTKKKKKSKKDTKPDVVQHLPEVKKEQLKLPVTPFFHCFCYKTVNKMPWLNKSKLLVVHDIQLHNGLNSTGNAILMKGEGIVPCGDFEVLYSSLVLPAHVTDAITKLVKQQMEHGVLKNMGTIVSRAIGMSPEHSKEIQKVASIPSGFWGGNR